MNEKVLLINPPGPRRLYRDNICSILSKASYVWKPKGHIMLSAVIPPEWEVKFIDASIRGLSQRDIFEAIDAYKPSLIASAVSLLIWDKDYAFIKDVRNKFPGTHITVFGDSVRERYFFDLLMRIADEAFLDPFTYDIANYRSKRFNSFEMIEGYRRDKAARHVNTYLPRQRLFDSILYRWPFVKHSRYAAVYTQFGCPFTCSYCPAGSTPLSCRGAGGVLKELRQAYEEGYKEIHFGDDTFGFPRENAMEILQGMLKAGYGFSWSAYTHPGSVDKNYLSLMKESGCHTLAIGIDSSDFNLLKEYGRAAGEDGILEFIKNCKEFGIEVCGDFILGFEEEDVAAVLNTIKFALGCGLDYASFNSAAPLSATSIRRQKISDGIIGEGGFGYDTCGYRVLGTKNIDSRQLKRLLSLAVRKFYFRPGYIMERLSRIRSPEEFALRFGDGMGVLRNAILNR